jgi:hypothetical protein
MFILLGLFSESTSYINSFSGLFSESTSNGFFMDISAPHIIAQPFMSRDVGSVHKGTSILRSAIRFKWEVEDRQSFIQKQFISVSTHNGGEFNNSSVMVSAFTLFTVVYNVNVFFSKDHRIIFSNFFYRNLYSLQHQTSNILLIYKCLTGKFSQSSHYNCRQCIFMIQIQKIYILILFASFYDFDILFWNSPDSVVFYCFSRFWNSPDSMVFYCFSRFWNSPDSVVFYVFLDFGTVLTVWYFIVFLDFGAVLTVWYFMFF